MSESFEKNAKLFLNNKPSEGSSVRWSVTASPGASFIVVDSEVVISDCHKQVTLDFCAYKVTDIKGRLDKLDTLVNSLEEFREALQEAERFLAANKPKKKKKKKAKLK